MKKDKEIKNQPVLSVKYKRSFTVRKITTIDTLAELMGPQLRKEFPTINDFNLYLEQNRKSLYEKIYGPKI